MPSTVRTENENGNDEEVAESSTAEDLAPAVTDYLDMALTTARDEGMSASELMGLFFYYAHSIAEGYREDILRELDAAD